MLRPNKYTDLRATHLHVGAAVLYVIQTQGRASMAEIEGIVARWCGDVSPRRIHETLILLYAIGALEYAEEFDAFIAVPWSEAA